MLVPRWFDRWFSPTVVIFLLTTLAGGGFGVFEIVASVRKNSDSVMRLEQTSRFHETNHHDTTRELSQVLESVKHIDRRVDRLESTSDHHRNDDFTWKQRVIKIEEQLKGNGP